MGWSIDRRPTAAMVNQALGMAIEQRAATPATTIHSDHGSQFTSWTFSRRVSDAGLPQSFGSIGDGYDNAMVESLWARMQVELLNRQRWRTRLELSTAMFDWIEGFYNPTRRHSALGNISPVEFERRHAHPATAA